MADLNRYQASTNINRQHSQHFRFKATATSADPESIIPTAGALSGVTTIDGSGTGIYTIVLDRAHGELVGVHCSTLGAAAASHEYVHAVSYTASTKTLVLQSSLADATGHLDDDSWVCVHLIWALYAADAPTGANAVVS